MGTSRRSVPRSKATTRLSSTTTSNPVARTTQNCLPANSDSEDEPVHKHRRTNLSSQSAGIGSDSDSNQTDAGEPFIEQPSDEELASTGEEAEEIVGSDEDANEVRGHSDFCNALSQRMPSCRTTLL
jgi:hypothetical protein